MSCEYPVANAWMVLGSDGEPNEEDLDVVAEIVELFLEDAATRIGAIARAIAAGDCTTVRFEAHTLKGGAAQVAAEPLRSLCERLEYAARAGDTTADFAGLHAEVAAAFALAREALLRQIEK